jgi:hypothetical protein
MTGIAQALDRFRREPTPPEARMKSPFKLMSTVCGPADVNEVSGAWGETELPADLVELWMMSRETRLFEDVENGQWGLVLLTPEGSAGCTAREREARPSDLRPDDIVIGEFLGDQELVVLAPSETGRRRMLIALPLDHRGDWFGAASNLGEFLENYFDAGGTKFWEGQEANIEDPRSPRPTSPADET